MCTFFIADSEDEYPKKAPAEPFFEPGEYFFLDDFKADPR